MDAGSPSRPWSEDVNAAPANLAQGSRSIDSKKHHRRGTLAAGPTPLPGRRATAVAGPLTAPMHNTLFIPFYPDTKEYLIAGPAEGFVAIRPITVWSGDETGRSLLVARS